MIERRVDGFRFRLYRTSWDERGEFATAVTNWSSRMMSS